MIFLRSFAGIWAWKFIGKQIVRSVFCLWTCHTSASFNVPWFLDWKMHWAVVLTPFSCHLLFINYCPISLISSSGLKSPSVWMIPQINLSFYLKVLAVLCTFPIYIYFVIRGSNSVQSVPDVVALWIYTRARCPLLLLQNS